MDEIKHFGVKGMKWGIRNSKITPRLKLMKKESYDLGKNYGKFVRNVRDGKSRASIKDRIKTLGISELTKTQALNVASHQFSKRSKRRAANSRAYLSGYFQELNNKGKKLTKSQKKQLFQSILISARTSSVVSQYYNN